MVLKAKGKFQYQFLCYCKQLGGLQIFSHGRYSCSGHVPYRDSKLTRILQPALGGNANTAIICNITLSQVSILTWYNILEDYMDIFS